MAYKLGDVWSETFPTDHNALEAAKNAAQRQQIGGRGALIRYETEDGLWREEAVSGGDRPEVDVKDDG